MMMAMRAGADQMTAMLDGAAVPSRAAAVATITTKTTKTTGTKKTGS
jgi:hypothetical protein